MVSLKQQVKVPYNKYISSIKKDECMDCGSSNIVVHHDALGKLCKRCLVCGKEYYV